MARNNKLGNSFYALELEKAEEKAIKAYLKKTDKTGKQFLRSLVRDFLRVNNLLKQIKDEN